MSEETPPPQLDTTTAIEQSIADARHATARELLARFGERARGAVAIAATALALSGCFAPSSDQEQLPPTQEDVASTELFGTSIGLEGDANGLFNTREAITPQQNEYTKDSLADQIGGLPNLVIGTPDPKADGAPIGDGWHADRGKRGGEGSETSTGEIEIPIPEITPAKPPTEKTITGEEPANTQYERDFETDTATKEQALTTAEQVAAETLKLLEDGYTVKSVQITGRASGEDHTYSDNVANIGSSSTNNQDLANQRALHGTKALDEAMEKQGIDLQQMPLHIAGQEVEPSSEQMVQLQDAADSLGITVSELTERFNTATGTFTPEQFSLLTQSLVENRGVLYEIHASKDGSQRSPDFKMSVVKIPYEIKDKFGVEGDDGRFRVEIPGEVLLLLLGIASLRLAGGLSIPTTPEMPQAGTWPPSPPKPTVKPPTVEPPPPPPPPPPEDINHPRTPRNIPMPRSRQVDPVMRRKQPRNHNYHHNERGAMAGGRGRMARTKGGSRSGKR